MLHPIQLNEVQILGETKPYTCHQRTLSAVVSSREEFRLVVKESDSPHSSHQPFLHEPLE